MCMHASLPHALHYPLVCLHDTLHFAAHPKNLMLNPAQGRPASWHVCAMVSNVHLCMHTPVQHASCSSTGEGGEHVRTYCHLMGCQSDS